MCGDWRAFVELSVMGARVLASRVLGRSSKRYLLLLMVLRRTAECLTDAALPVSMPKRRLLPCCISTSLRSNLKFCSLMSRSFSHVRN